MPFSDNSMRLYEVNRMKYIETDIWCISTNGEDFLGDDYSSREEAIEAVKKDYGAGYYVKPYS